MSIETGTEWTSGEEDPPATVERSGEQWRTTAADPCFLCEGYDGKLARSWALVGHPWCACEADPVSLTYHFIERKETSQSSQPLSEEAAMVPPLSSATFSYDGDTYTVRNDAMHSRMAYFKFRRTGTRYSDLYRCSVVDRPGDEEVTEYAKKVETRFVGVTLGL